MAGKFEVYKDKAGEFRFRLKASNDQIILVSEGYKTMASCKNGVDSVKSNAPVDARYERKAGDTGKFSFNLKATNGQVVATSGSYASEAARDSGIDSVKASAPDASVSDLTV